MSLSATWRSVASAAIALTVSLPAAASVRFSDWHPETVLDLVRDQAGRGGLVMVVISQPDWCPACIQLDHDILRNPAASDIAELTRDWLVLEVYGYDDDGAQFLQRHGLRFVGTPTTLLIRPGTGDNRLGDGKLVASIAGYPDDYVARLSRAASGFDAIAAAQQAARDDGSVDNFAALANAYVEHGDAAAASRVYRSLLLRDDIDDERRAELRWSLVTEVHQRVEKDHARTLRELIALAGDYPQLADESRFTYATVWSLLELGRVADARHILKSVYLGANDPDRLADYLYLVFRHPSNDLIAEAEIAARAGIVRYPEHEPRLTAALARILRRKGCLDEAAEAFSRAATLAGPEHASYRTYVGQYDYVRAELADGRPSAGCVTSPAAL